MEENKKLPQIRVLQYLHIASSKLQNDSNFLTHRFMFKYFKRYYPDNFHFYLTYPESEDNKNVMNKFLGDYKNITFVPIKYYSTNAFFRNALDWENLGKIAKDYDMVFNNTPEIAYELLSYSISKGIYCGILNYAHWYPEMINGPIFANYLKFQPEKYCLEVKYFVNFLLSNNNYIDSDFGRKAIINGTSKTLGEQNAKKVENSLKTLYLTIDHEEIDEVKDEKIEVPDCPVLIFNHRHQVYTGFTEFMIGIKEIIKLRPSLKFKIFISDGGNMDLRDKFGIPEEYLLNVPNNSYKDYVRILWNIKGIQMGTHIGQNQWSLAFIDGMFTNNIPFYRKNIFFDEMFKNMDEEFLYPFQYKGEKDFVGNLIFMIENFDKYYEKRNIFFDHFRKYWTWDTLIHNWAKAIFKVYDETRTYKNSDKIDTVEFQTPITWDKCKGVLNISDQRPTNQYRKTLKEKYNLKEDMNNPEIVLYKQDEKIRKTEGFF